MGIGGLSTFGFRTLQVGKAVLLKKGVETAFLESVGLFGGGSFNGEEGC